MSNAQGFEVAPYSDPVLDIGKAYGVVRQILFEQGRLDPTMAVWADMSGNQLRIHYHGFEMHLPTRLKEVEDRANTAMRDLVSLIKREFRARTKHDLSIKERKDLADRSVEKVSLNERYYFKAWRCFEVSI